MSHHQKPRHIQVVLHQTRKSLKQEMGSCATLSRNVKQTVIKKTALQNINIGTLILRHKMFYILLFIHHLWIINFHAKSVSTILVVQTTRNKSAETSGSISAGTQVCHEE